MRRFLSSASGLQIIVCVLGCIASLVPFVRRTEPVWGWVADSNADHPGVLIESVEPGSPVAASGISANDRVLAVAGKPINQFNDWVSTLANLEPGAVVTVQIRRGEEELNLKLGAVPPRIAAVVLHRQVVASLAFVLLGILLFITGRLSGSFGLWRPVGRPPDGDGRVGDRWLVGVLRFWPRRRGHCLRPGGALVGSHRLGFAPQLPARLVASASTGRQVSRDASAAGPACFVGVARVD